MEKYTTYISIFTLNRTYLVTITYSSKGQVSTIYLTINLLISIQ